MDLVTGATGHIGSNLVRALVERGRDVRVLVRDPDSPCFPDHPVDVRQGDVCDRPSLRSAFDGIEHVYHLAGRISIDGDHDGRVCAVNVDGTANVARAALQAGVRRLIHFSSIHAFEHHATGPVTEEAPRVCAHSRAPAYDRSKAAGEAAVRKGAADGLDAVIVHPSAVIGPFDERPSRMGEALLALYHGRLPALVEGGCDWVDVRDVVTGAITAAHRATPGSSYILGGQWRPLGDLASMVAALPGAKRAPPMCPMWLARVGAPFMTGYARLRGREPLYTAESLRALRGPRFDHQRARDDLGYQPRPIEQTIGDLFDWFGARGLLDPALGTRRPN